MSDNSAKPPKLRKINSLSPEARGEAAEELRGRVTRRIGPGTYVFNVAKRVTLGVWNDGSIHAGNLAYMSMLAIFPFFILGAAIFSAFGEESEQMAFIEAVLATVPPVVANVLEPVARDVVQARSGWLLWAGALVGFWTVSSLIETIRDILRRSYGTEATHAFWEYRLFSAGIIFLSVVMVLLSLIAQVLIGTALEVIDAYIPWFANVMSDLTLSRIIPAIGLYGALYLLFYSLTPHKYRSRAYPKWPGALAVTLWWVGVTIALPPIMRDFFTYDLTYGSLAGIMIVLFFFYLVGLGMVVGAELNAALAITPEEKQLAKAATKANAVDAAADVAGAAEAKEDLQ